MSIIYFSALGNGQTREFAPLDDTLYFDAAGISAANLAVSLVDLGTTRIVAGGKTLTLRGLSLEGIDSWNVLFANGSRLLVGDDSVSGTNGSGGYPLWGTDSAGNELYGGAFNDQLLGLGGDDSLSGGLGNDLINGGDGNDIASYEDVAVGVTVSLAITVAQNTVGAGTDTLVSVENLIGSGLNDRLTGNAQDNVLEGLDGNDLLNGGAGNDTAAYRRASAAVRVSLAVATAQNTLGAGTDTLSNFENLLGSEFNDTLTGNAAANRLDGGEGDDTLVGGAGDDSYWVDSRRDQTTEAAGAGSDTVYSSVDWTLAANIENLVLLNDSLTSSAGSIILQQGINGIGNTLNNTISGNRWNNNLDGGAGTDTVSYAAAPNGVQVNLVFTSRQDTGWGRDTIRNFENVQGSGYADRLLGNAGNNALLGGAGDDFLVGAAGNDSLTGGTGQDTASYFNAGAAVTVNLGLAAAQNTVGAGTDLLSGIEHLQGGAFNDTLTGSGGDNVLEGMGGNDRLTGGAGSDTASYASATAAVRVSLAIAAAQGTGGAGTDTLAGIEHLRGSAFNDTLTGSGLANRIDGGAGGDTMAGGAGDDTYRVDTNAETRLVVANGSESLVDWSGPADTVNESAGAGNDTVETYVSFTLPNNVENLIALDLRNGSYTPGLALTGNGLNNLIVDHRGSNTIDGGAGTDTLSFRNATDSVAVILGQYSNTASGGNGYDRLSGIENIIGSASNDDIMVDGVGNRYDGGAGNDTLSYANVPLSGSYPAYTQPNITATLASTAPQNTVGAGTDTILNFENLTGGGGNDRLTGNSGDNRLTGESGDDTLEGGAGNDTLIGGVPSGTYNPPASGTDTASYATATAGVAVNLALTSAQNTLGAGRDRLQDIDNLIGSAFNDTLTGGLGNNLLAGGAGNDLLDGGAGSDTLVGSAGTDTLTGGAGIDTADFQTATAGVSANLGTGAVSGGAGNDTLRGIEDLAGSAFNDTLTGDANANRLTGGAGNDSLDGANGDDLLIGGPGNNALNGGAGSDTASYADAAAGVTVDLGVATAQDTGGAGDDTLADVENLLGSALNDRLTGSAADNLIDGGGGNDTLAGGAGSDTLSYASFARPQYEYNTLYVDLTNGQSSYAGYYSPPYYVTRKDTLSGFENVIGSSGDDDLRGDADNNLLAGGAGGDTLTGGGGADRFRFTTTADGSDRIEDFVPGTDKIEVVGPNFGGLPAGPLAAARLLAAGTTPTNTNAVFIYSASTGALSFDSDGSGRGAAVQFATLANLASGTTLAASDIQIVAA